jgi:hypothetical protein
VRSARVAVFALGCAATLGCGALIGFGDLDVAVTDSEGGVVDGGRFCAPDAHAFCTDFDEEDAGGAWTTLSGPPPGALDLAGTRSRSAPHAARAQDPRRGAGVYRHVSLTKVFPRAWTRTVVEFDAFVGRYDKMVGDSNAGLVALNFKSSDPARWQGTAFSVSPLYSALGTQSADADGGPLREAAMTVGPVAFDQWIHVTLDVIPGGAVTIRAGELRAFTSLPALAPAAGGRVELEIGVIGYNAPAPSSDVSIDNVSVDFF